MLTDDQLRQAAVALLDQHLADLLDPAYETADWIDKHLCRDCPPNDCRRSDADAEREITATQQHLRDLTAQLRRQLAQLTNTQRSTT